MEREKKFNRFLPQWVGAPKKFVEKIQSFYAFMEIDWVGNFEIDDAMEKIGASYIAARETGKFRFGDFYRFKKRYYDVLIPCFDRIESAYKAELAGIAGERRKEILPVIYTANILAVQKCLDYVDFFFWREIVKFGKTPSDLKISYKPSVAYADFEWIS